MKCWHNKVVFLIGFCLLSYILAQIYKECRDGRN